MIRAGSLRHKVLIYLPIDTITDKGDDLVTYPVDANITAYASIEPLQPRELVVARQVRADVTHKITLRWNPNFNHRMKVTWYDGTRTSEYHLGPEMVDRDSRNWYSVFYAYRID